MMSAIRRVFVALIIVSILGVCCQLFASNYSSFCSSRCRGGDDQVFTKTSSITCEFSSSKGSIVSCFSIATCYVETSPCFAWLALTRTTAVFMRVTVYLIKCVSCTRQYLQGHFWRVRSREFLLLFLLCSGLQPNPGPCNGPNMEFTPIAVKGNGHCFLYALQVSLFRQLTIKHNIQELLCMLRQEIHQNAVTDYIPFYNIVANSQIASSTSIESSMLRDFDVYARSKRYDQGIVDLLPAVAANCLNIELHVCVIPDMRWDIFRPKIATVSRGTIYLQLSNQHYTTIIKCIKESNSASGSISQATTITMSINEQHPSYAQLSSSASRQSSNVQHYSSNAQQSALQFPSIFQHSVLNAKSSINTPQAHINSQQSSSNSQSLSNAQQHSSNAQFSSNAQQSSSNMQSTYKAQQPSLSNGQQSPYKVQQYPTITHAGFVKSTTRVSI